MTDSKKRFDKKGSGNMNNIAKTVFAPIYPVIVDNIIRRFGINEGICIDLGSGPASLSIAVAEKTDLDVIAFDYSEDMQEAASKNIIEAGLEGRITLTCGDVHDMPFGDDYADLIISRGSMFFWDDIHTAFKEIYRILKPGGKTYIGGGFGNKELFESVSAEMIRKNPEWEEFSRKNMSDENIKRFKDMLVDIGVPDYDIIHGDEGFWVVISKKTSGALP
ncbi:class I SAM-dependent methyltransferase [Methanoplanus limicola]|uniref:Methyltransferase type 11 n=1 Tax=Methanoplanus limicola DSM 2279 TaxID=937775 RepID=H1YZL5_9EURY|nr:class I SAM-dependent methyltransferase [Methanoplanus limicola]EHQ36124.1 Methyltransferase type 11 [Methanoplanus limicola DSM 2279]